MSEINKISVIIPVKNEESTIDTVVTSIEQALNKEYLYEIFVVNNGSTDKTSEILKTLNCKSITVNGKTVAAIRNIGAKLTDGEVLVFLDGDVVIQDTWAVQFKKVLEYLRNNPYTVTGSTVDIADDKNLIEKCWFKRHGKQKRYINSGHLITTRELFNSIGGFQESLITGEDSDFCERAKAQGAKIIDWTELHVRHFGFPRTLKDFFSREVWHGIGDFQSIRHLIRSKPALISVFQFFLFLVAISAGILYNNFVLLYYYTIIIAIIGILSAWKRNSEVNACLFFNSFLYVVYFWARTCSLFVYILRKK